MAADLRLDGVTINGRSVNAGSTASGVFHAGDIIELEWDVDNIGSTSAAASRVGIYFVTGSGSELVDTNTTSTISAGGSDTNETDSFTLPDNLAPGTYAILLFADDQGAVSESNESNNGYSFFITVVAGTPDLVIDDVTLNGDAVDDGETLSTVYLPGDTMELNWDVDNRGSSSAGSSRAGVYLITPTGSILLDSNTTSALSAGDSDVNESESFTLPSNLGPGLYAIAIIADDQGQVGEANESNNAYRFFFEVAAAPGTVDDVAQDTSTNATLSPGTITGNIDAFDISGDPYDGDYYEVALIAGHTYTFSASANVSSSDTLDSVRIRLRDASGNIMSPDPTASGATPSFTFTAASSGTYFLAISAAGAAPEDKTGAYTITMTDNGGTTTDSVAQDTSTNATLSPGTIASTIDAFDMSGDPYDGDYYEVTLSAGHSYTFSASANVSSTDTLDSVRIRLRDASGNIMSPDPTASGAAPSFTFTAASSGAYFLAISAAGAAPEDKTGAYTITMTDSGGGTNAPTVAILANSSYAAGTILTGAQLFSVSDPQGSSDINYVEIFDAIEQGGAVWRYDGQIISPGSTGFRLEYADRHLVTYTVGNGSNQFLIEAVDNGNESGDALHTITGTTSQPGDTAGQTRASARDLGAVAGGTHFLSEAVGTNDPSDYFRFVVTQSGLLQASISGLANDADLFLLSETGATIEQSRRSGTAIDSVAHQITPGIYYINVDQYSGDTAYQLTYSFTPEILPPTQSWSISSPGVVSEGTTSIAFTITRPENLDAQTVYVTTTEVGGVHNVGDFDPLVSTAYTFAAGQTTRTVTVQLNDDAFQESSETFGIVVRASIDSDIPLASNTFTVSDNDATPPHTTLPSSEAIFASFGLLGSIGFLGTLALAAYRLTSAPTEQGSELELHHAAASAFEEADAVLRLLTAADLSGLSAGSISNGIFTNSNAGALVGICGDAIFIAFRGTNDNDLKIPDDVLYGIGPPDVDDWMSTGPDDPEGMARHWSLLTPLLDAVESFRAEHGIQMVYVTGHSLGSAMAQRFMSTNLGDPSYRAITFASPGFEGIADVPGDNRTLTFNISEDIVPTFSLWNDYGEIGTEVRIQNSNPPVFSATGPNYHDPVLYQQIALLIAAGGVDIRSLIKLDYSKTDLWRVYYPHGTINGSQDSDTLRSLSGSDIIHGLGGDDFLYSGDGADQVFGGDGDDFAVGGAGGGDDLYDGGSDIDTLSYESTSQGVLVDLSLAQNQAAGAEIGVDQIIAFENVIGGSGNDRIIGGEGENELYGGPGNDNLYSYSEDFLTSTVVDDGANILDGGDGADTLRGAGGAEILSGGEGDDTLGGRGGADLLDGGAGVDMAIVTRIHLDDDYAFNFSAGAGGDIIEPGGAHFISIERLQHSGGGGADTVIGGSFADLLQGGAGNDVLTTLGGDDRLDGQGGDDLLYGGSGYDALFGGDGDDANAPDGNDLLDGGLGGDYLVGGLGDDIYVVDDSNDYILEAADEGADTVRSYISHALAANVENLTLIGGAAIDGSGNDLANTIIGSSAANHLFGFAGNDVLNGLAGADTMAGGAGDDLYVVENAGDAIVELGGGGFDTVQSWISYALTSQVEALTLLGAGGVNATGNGLNNILIGNTGWNVLNGGFGADSMSGGLGNDTYFVDNLADTVTETGVGLDTVNSTVSFTLGADVENLSFGGSANVNGAGNELNNKIIGNSGVNNISGGDGFDILFGNGGNDILDGGLSQDQMYGGLGDDTYYVSQTNDTAFENSAGEGADIVYSAAVNYTISAGVEHLTLLEGAGGGSKGIGNLLDNHITGNSLNNILFGKDGADVLDGGGGADTMYGGAGDDNFYVDNAGDVASENASEGTDTVIASVTYTLRANFETLVLADSGGAINGFGSTGANFITGNTSDNTLNGGAGNDILNGGLGNDTLIGAAGDDTFSFVVGGGQDTVTGLVVGGAEDSIDLSAYNGSGVTWSITQVGADTLFSFTNGDSITLTNVDNTQLVQDDAFHYS